MTLHYLTKDEVPQHFNDELTLRAIIVDRDSPFILEQIHDVETDPCFVRWYKSSQLFIDMMNPKPLDGFFELPDNFNLIDK